MRRTEQKARRSRQKYQTRANLEALRETRCTRRVAPCTDAREELSFDYTTTEWSLDGGGFVDASTGRPARGFKYLEEEQKRRLLQASLLPAHILQLWLGEVLDA